MRSLLPAAVALCFFAIVASCLGPSSGTESGNFHASDAGIATGAGDAGDGGVADAGDAGPGGGDAGFVFDGGCAHGFNAQANDGCFAHGPVQASLIDSACVATLYLNGVATCSGVLGGSQDAFDGGCSNLTCFAPQLPGTITCHSGVSSCTIVICGADGGPDGGCP